MSTAITNTVSRFFTLVDQCDWPQVQALMTERFYADYSSYSGVPASEVTPQALTESWGAILPYFDHVHHQIGNLVVDEQEDTATVQCHGTATHFIADQPDGDTQWVVGTYDLFLKRQENSWTLSGMRFHFKYTTGNTALAEEAMRRAELDKQEPSHA